MRIKSIADRKRHAVSLLLVIITEESVLLEDEGVVGGAVANPIAFAAFDVGIDVGVDGHECD